MSSAVLFDPMDTDELVTAVADQQRIWTARRQVLERRKKNVDKQLEIAREKTEALRVLGGDVFSKNEARVRISALRYKLDVELERWKFDAATQEDFQRGYFSDKTREVRPVSGMIERMLRDLYEEPSALTKEREAEKIVDLVAAEYENSVMMFRLVVDHESDVHDFVSDYASELGLELRFPD